MFEKLTAATLNRSLNTYMPSLDTKVIPNDVVKWGVVVRVYDIGAWYFYAREGQYWMISESGNVGETSIPVDSGVQNIAAYIACLYIRGGYLLYGADSLGRINLPKELEQLHATVGEAYSFLTLLASRQIPFTDDADAFARELLDGMKSLYTS